MSENNLNKTFEDLVKNVENLISTKTVVGESKVFDDTVIIPLVDVTFGIAAGDSSNDKKNGSGGGITGKMSPCAVLIIKNGNAKVVNIKNQDILAKIVDLVPDMVDKFTGKKSDLPSNDEALDMAFPPVADED